MWEQARIWGCKGYFDRISPNVPEKRLRDKLSLYKFSVAVGTSRFPLSSCHRLENRKCMQDYCQKLAGTRGLSIFLTVRNLGVPFAF